MGGVGLSHGIAPEVQTAPFQPPHSELLVLDTDSRSTGAPEARASVRKAMGAAGSSSLVYKKVDSAMRGNILAELEAILPETGRDSALLVPANPTLGRTIRRDHYFIRGIPIHETDFSRDPEHPAKTSKVGDLLGESRSLQVKVLEKPQSVPAGTIAIGEVEDFDDLLEWANHLGPDCLPAGGSDFFTAILEARGHKGGQARNAEVARSGMTLFVCGSSSDYSHAATRLAHDRGLPVSWMPQQALLDGKVEDWARNTSMLLDRHSLAIIAVGRVKPVTDADLARRIRDGMAALVERVLSANPVEELYVEGGATTSSITRLMGWNLFFPVEELSRGVVRMRVNGTNLHITIKPGSYRWPEGVPLHATDS
jgi:uncharacterized protein YgbK (DUF1537 family)